MKELSPEEIVAFESDIKQRQEVANKKVREYLNRPIKDKNGKEKLISVHMRTEYLAQAIDDLHEMCRNSIQLHVANLYQNISILWNSVDKIKERLAILEQQTGETK